jgi:hypothetical protein
VTSAKKMMFHRWAGKDFPYTEELFELMCQAYTYEFLIFQQNKDAACYDNVLCTAIQPADPFAEKLLTVFLKDTHLTPE